MDFLFTGLNSLFQLAKIDLMRREESTMAKKFQLTGNILIISDRLGDVAVELMSSIRSLTDANVIGNITCYDDLSLEYLNNVDYLIIVGYLCNEKNYQIVNRLRSNNKQIKTVKWASLDNLVESYCIKHKIIFTFDKCNSITDFIRFLMAIRDKDDSQFISIWD